MGGDEAQTPETGQPDPDIAIEPPDQYAEPAETHESSGDGPAQWEQP